MIKVGDYIEHKSNGMIYEVVGSSEKLLYITDHKKTWQYIGINVAINNYLVVDYKQLYEQQKHRADKAEKRADAADAIIASIKSHLDDLWMDGNASEHEYAFNTLKHIEKIERGEA